MIKNIAVIGAGTMGCSIAHVFARHGYQVALYDAFEDSRTHAPDKIAAEMQVMVEEDYIAPAAIETALRNITVHSELAAAVAEADYVIEAIPERMELKKQLFAQLDTLCPPHTVFATNTSSLRLGEMIAELPKERQSRCMVSHWYNPAHLIPIAELSKFGNMPEEVFNEVYELYVNSGKQPICVLKDITGMIANRLLHAQAREAFHLVEIGAASAEDIDKTLKYGPCFRNATTGMLEVADMGGLDVWLATADNLYPALAGTDHGCDALRQRVAAQELGIKTGKGFFTYAEEDREAAREAFYKRLIVQLKASENY